MLKLSNLKIDPEFSAQILPLSFEELQQLEQNIIAEGRLLNPIITWNGYILDGHTRYRILKKHGFIKFEVEEIQFAEGNIACIVNNSVESMYAEAVMKENELCVSLEWFARRFLRLSVSECDEVVYATDHPSRISWHMADLIRTYLT